eukprot:s1927_g3.t3
MLDSVVSASSLEWRDLSVALETQPWQRDVCLFTIIACMSLNSLNLDTACYIVHGTNFQVSKRYTVLEQVGQGAYGIVCAAQDDEETQESVAVKKIENAPLGEDA